MKKSCNIIVFGSLVLLSLFYVFTLLQGLDCLAYFKGLESRGCLFLKGNEDYLTNFFGEKSEKGFTIISGYESGGNSNIYYCERAEVEICESVLQKPSCYIGKYKEDTIFSCADNGKAVVIRYDSFSRKVCEELVAQATIFSEKYIGREFVSCEFQEYALAHKKEEDE
jgi:hypothetical protein